MEAGALGELRVELHGLEKRVDGIHHGLGVVRGQSASHETSISVIHSELRNVSEDIAELKGQMKWVLRGLFAGIAVGLAVLTAVATLVVQLAGG